MLIEILPFLRGIASSIQKRLGDDNPNVLPTVMVAYTMTSFLIGIIFIALAVFRCGRLVSPVLIISLNHVERDSRSNIFRERCCVVLLVCNASAAHQRRSDIGLQEPSGCHFSYWV